MIREFHLSDLPRQLAPGRLDSQDLAHTREALLTPAHRVSPLELAWHTMGPSPRRHALAVVEGAQVLAVAVMRPRSGSGAWELSHIYVSPRWMHRCEALLEHCSAYVGNRGAERLFLRVLEESPLQEVARRTGFFACHTEQVYELNRRITDADRSSLLRLRSPTSADLHPLFQLYNACATPAVRSAYGLTLDQWRDAQEVLSGEVEQYVWEREGQLIGWFRLARHGGVVTVDALLHPEVGSAAPLLWAAVARLASPHRRLAWVVTGHQTALQNVLEEAGWELTRTYTVLIKTVVVRVTQMGMAPVQV